MLGHRDLGWDDYVEILRRHLWLIIIPTALGPIVGYGTSLFLPEKYTSQTLVLVEQQKIPEKFVTSVVTDQLNERLGTMKEQILSRTRLQPIIEANKLYKEEADKAPMEDLVNKMRKGILVTPVRSTVAKGGVPGFAISFTHQDPQTAQLVCQQITSMFMEENLKIREKRAESTTAFLQKQLDDAKKKLDEQDARLAAFKRRYIGQLPGQEAANMNLLMGRTAQLEAITQQMNRTQQDRTYSESILAQQEAAWKASQSGSNPQALDAQLNQLQNQLVTLEGRYTPDYPDVKKAKLDIAQLRKKIEEANRTASTQPAEKPKSAALVEPPQIQNLRNQIRLYEQSLREKTRDQERLQKEITTLQARVQLSPAIEQEFKDLTRDHATAQDFYNELLGKKTQSEMSADLERRQQGEQFRVMDPANLPASPTFPNRPLFAAGGLGAGLALGLGLAMLLEFRDKSIRNERDVEFYLELPALGMLPTVGEENGNKSSFWKRRKSQAVSAD